MHIAVRHVRLVLCAVCDGVGCLGCMSDDDLTILGEVRYGAASAADRFGIRRADRRAHFYAQGKTQTGKSTLLAIRTPINTAAWETPEAYADLMRLVPYKRIGEPEDIARAAVWLASDEADYVTGTTLYVDGGMTLYPGFATGG